MLYLLFYVADIVTALDYSVANWLELKRDREKRRGKRGKDLGWEIGHSRVTTAVLSLYWAATATALVIPIQSYMHSNSLLATHTCTRTRSYTHNSTIRNRKPNIINTPRSQPNQYWAEIFWARLDGSVEEE